MGPSANVQQAEIQVTVKDDIRKGYLLMVISAFFFSSMGVMVKFTRDMPLFERVFFRNLVMLILVVILIRSTGQSFLGSRKSRKALVLRSLFGFSGVILYFFTISSIPLGDAVTLNKLSPFVVLIAASIFLKERIKPLHGVSIVIVFTGVLLITKPGFNPDLIPALAGIGSAVMAGLAYTIIRYLGPKEHPYTIIFYFCAISTVLSIPLMAMDFRLPTWLDLLPLVMIGLFASGGQLFMTLSYRYGEAHKVSILGYFTVVFSLIFGFIFFSEVPDILSGVGMSLIVGTALLLYVSDRKRGK